MRILLPWRRRWMFLWLNVQQQQQQNTTATEKPSTMKQSTWNDDIDNDEQQQILSPKSPVPKRRARRMVALRTSKEQPAAAAETTTTKTNSTLKNTVEVLVRITSDSGVLALTSTAISYSTRIELLPIAKRSWFLLFCGSLISSVVDCRVDVSVFFMGDGSCNTKQKLFWSSFIFNFFSSPLHTKKRKSPTNAKLDALHARLNQSMQGKLT